MLFGGIKACFLGLVVKMKGIEAQATVGGKAVLSDVSSAQKVRKRLEVEFLLNERLIKNCTSKPLVSRGLAGVNSFAMVLHVGANLFAMACKYVPHGARCAPYRAADGLVGANLFADKFIRE